jgi:hypothetical protein
MKNVDEIRKSVETERRNTAAIVRQFMWASGWKNRTVTLTVG